MLRSFQTFQIMRQRIEVLRRNLDDRHVRPGLDALWVDNPRCEITAGRLERSGRDVTTAADMGQVGSTLPPALVPRTVWHITQGLERNTCSPYLRSSSSTVEAAAI